ncbi:MAG: hypothetical protein BYD32DRAFT_414663 [Podila humilis]|nr:MAG: hypothetical protein BYD32DRAFT_414663 [Podila humilis]
MSVQKPSQSLSHSTLSHLLNPYPLPPLLNQSYPPTTSSGLEAFEPELVDETIGFMLHNGSTQTSASVLDLIEEFTSAITSLGPRKHARDNDEPDSSSDETNLDCRTCRSAKRQQLGPATLLDPTALILGVKLIKEARRLMQEKNERTRLLVLTDIIDARLDYFATVGRDPRTAPDSSKPSPQPRPNLSTSLSNSPSTRSTQTIVLLRRSKRVAAQKDFLQKK